LRLRKLQPILLHQLPHALQMGLAVGRLHQRGCLHLQVRATMRAHQAQLAVQLQLPRSLRVLRLEQRPRNWVLYAIHVCLLA
jgi:hypothetical protein